MKCLILALFFIGCLDDTVVQSGVEENVLDTIAFTDTVYFNESCDIIQDCDKLISEIVNKKIVVDLNNDTVMNDMGGYIPIIYVWVDLYGKSCEIENLKRIHTNLKWEIKNDLFWHIEIVPNPLIFSQNSYSCYSSILDITDSLAAILYAKHIQPLKDYDIYHNLVNEFFPKHGQASDINNRGTSIFSFQVQGSQDSLVLVQVNPTGFLLLLTNRNFSNPAGMFADFALDYDYSTEVLGGGSLEDYSHLGIVPGEIKFFHMKSLTLGALQVNNVFGGCYLFGPGGGTFCDYIDDKGVYLGGSFWNRPVSGSPLPSQPPFQWYTMNYKYAPEVPKINGLVSLNGVDLN